MVSWCQTVGPSVCCRSSENTRSALQTVKWQQVKTVQCAELEAWQADVYISWMVLSWAVKLSCDSQLLHSRIALVKKLWLYMLVLHWVGL